MELPRQLRAENLALHYLLLEAQTQSSVVSQSESENSSCLDCTSDVSKSYKLQETETVACPQFSVVSQSESENFMQNFNIQASLCNFFCSIYVMITSLGGGGGG